MTVAYHLWQNSEAKGPFTIGQVRSMWNGGKLTGQDLFSTNGGQDWHYLTDLSSQLEEIAPANQNTEAVSVLKKIEKSQKTTEQNSSCVTLVIVMIVSLVILLGGAWVLLKMGQARAEADRYKAPDSSTESN